MNCAVIVQSTGGNRVENNRTSETPSYQELLEQELFAVERNAQYQSNWFLAFTVLLVYLITFLPSDITSQGYKVLVHTMVWVLLFWFVGNALAIHFGYYHRVLKYVNVIFQVSMVSFFLMVSARIMNVEFALASITPMFYVIVIAVSSLSLNPFLCLLAGGFAAGQFLGLYAFWLHDKLNFSVVEAHLFGWPSVVIRSVIFLVMGVAAMYMARKARSLLETVIVQVRYEEQLRFIQHDIDQAAEVQKHLIPSGRPDFAHLEIETCYKPSRQVGGDYIDYIYRPGGQYLVVIGDVSGKGFSAAMVMSNIQAMMQMLAKQDIPLDKLMDLLNQSVHRASAKGRFVSLACLEYDPATGKLHYINCGHNPPFLVNANHDVLELTANCPVLGVSNDLGFEIESVDFGTDDLLFAYTDGLSELRNPAKKMFGEERIEKVLHTVEHNTPAELRQAMLKATDDWLRDGNSNQVQLSDDMSFLCMRPKEVS